jgi:hypothetical protein
LSATEADPAIRNEVHDLVPLIHHAVELPPVVVQPAFTLAFEFAQPFDQALVRIRDAWIGEQARPELVQ